MKMKRLHFVLFLIVIQLVLMAVLFNGCEDISIIKNNVGFDFQPTSSIKVGDTIFFNNTSTGFINCLWDFGDGIESTLTAPTHVYEEKGLYTVTLKVCYKSSNQSIDTVELSKPLNVSLQPPNSSFTHTRIAELTIAFTNTSTNSTQCLWSFGDGATSTEASPTHTFNDFGDQTVTLTTFNDGCQDSIVKTIELSAEIDFNELLIDGNKNNSRRSIDIDFDGTTDLEISANSQYVNWGGISNHGTYEVIFTKGMNDYEIFIDTVMHNGYVIAQIHLPGDTLRINNTAQGSSTYLTRAFNSFGTDKWVNSNEIRYVGYRKCTNGINKLGWIKVKVTSLNDIILYSIRVPTEGDYLVIE